MIKRRTNVEIIALGFAIVILVGTFLLLLPVSSDHTDFLDALFTATSATCVTGLVVYDTATHWTLFGQIVILLLIQIGGLGGGPGRKAVNNAITLDQTDADLLLALEKKGISIYLQTTPDYPSEPLKKAVAKL